MPRSSSVSHFSIEMSENELYYVAAGKTSVSCFFKNKHICREFCSAVERSFKRLESRYMLCDYRASLGASDFEFLPKGGSEPGAS